MRHYRTINVPPGIGDSIWLLQKLVNAKDEKFNFAIPGGTPRRGKQIFDLLPDIVETSYYDPELKFLRIEANNVWLHKKNFYEIEDHEFNLCANKHLEEGNHISEFFPDLATTYDLKWQTEVYETEVAQMLAPYKVDENLEPIFIGIYTSAYNTARAWGFWDAKKWWEFIKLLKAKNPRYVFVVIGAEWDIDTAGQLMKFMKTFGVSYIDTVGQPLGFVIQMMKSLDFGFYFPSGLGILSGLMSRPSLMWYPKHLVKMQGTWKNPTNNTFHESQFMSPKLMLGYIDKIIQ
jgi:hypothetical protein